MQPQRSLLAHMTFHIFAQPNKGRARAKSVKPPSAKHTHKKKYTVTQITHMSLAVIRLYMPYIIYYIVRKRIARLPLRVRNQQASILVSTTISTVSYYWIDGGLSLTVNTWGRAHVSNRCSLIQHTKTPEPPTSISNSKSSNAKMHSPQYAVLLIRYFQGCSARKRLCNNIRNCAYE